MSKITGITLIAENGLTPAFDKKHINGVILAGVKKEIFINMDGEAEEVECCDRCVIFLDAGANYILKGDYVRYGTLFNMLRDDPCVTAVEIHYEDGSTREISLPWNEETLFCNLYMTTEIEPTGNAIITFEANYESEAASECECSCGDCIDRG